MQRRGSEATIPKSRARVPGLGSWLALLFTGMCALAWLNNEAIVAWALAKGLVEEGATETLLGEFRYAWVGAGALGLIAAWRIPAWAAWGTYQWSPVRASTVYVGRPLRPVVRPLASLVAAMGHISLEAARAVLGVLGRAAVFVLRCLWLVARIIGFTLRYLGHAVATALAYVGRALGWVLRYAWAALAVLLRLAWRGLVFVLGYLWLGISVGARYLWLAVYTPMRYLGLGVAAILHYSWAGVSAVFRAVDLMLRLRCLWLVARIIGFTLRYLGHAVATALAYVGRVLGWVLRYAWAALAVLLRLAWRGLVFVLGYLWLGISVGARYLWLAVYTPMRYLGLGVAAILHYSWAGVSAVFRAVDLMLRFLGMGVSAMAQTAGGMLRYLSRPLLLAVRHGWLGFSTIAFLLGWALGCLGRRMTYATRGLWVAVAFAMRTLWTGFRTMPDVRRIAVAMAQHRKGVAIMSEGNLTRQRVLSLVAVLWVLGIVGFFVARMVWPAPPEPTAEVVHWANGHLLRDGSGLRLLRQMAEEFNKAGHRTKSGTRIQVKVFYYGSWEQAKDLDSRVTLGVPVDRSMPDPTIVTPSASHWLVNVNAAAGRTVVDLEAARNIAPTMIGIVTYRDMAECLGWPQKEIGYADIIALRNDPGGWASYPCAKAEWGQRPLVVYTDPTTSDTGRGVLLTLYAIAAGKPPEELILEDVSRPEVVAYMKEFQRLIDHYMIATRVVNTKVYQGPRFGHFFLMPEDNLIHLYEGTEPWFDPITGKKGTAPPIERSMVMIYPKEGSMARENCACLVQAPWVSQEATEGAQQWVDFLMEDNQQRSFMVAGFRPGNGLSLDDPASRITARYGLDPAGPATVFNPSLIDPAVAVAIDQSWGDVKRSAVVTFVVDTSGSMAGGKLQQAKDGLILALDMMARNNQVGLVTFGGVIKNRTPVAPLAANKFLMADAANGMAAGGETALYDAIKAGIDLTDEAEGPPDAIRGVVVLTDGQANAGQVRLDSLIRMMSRQEVAIRQFDGFSNAQAVDARGGRVAREDITGTDLAMETRHPIQIFFVAIGDDADMQVGRILAEATGAEFQGATEKDLAKVMEEISKYF